MQTQILLCGITLDELRDTMQLIVSAEVQKAIDILTPKKNNDPELLTRKETAKILGISLVTLWNWTSNGILPGKRIGTRIRYEKQLVYNSLKNIEPQIHSPY